MTEKREGATPPASSAIAWDKVVRIIEPYVVRLSTPGGWGTGFFLVRSQDGGVTGIATAAHVIEHAHLWENPIRIQHPASRESLVVRQDTRSIHIDKTTDTAVLILPQPISTISFPDTALTLFPKGAHLTVGKEVGWFGFPAIPGAGLCFFSGRVSAWSPSLDAYFVDGNAINGVSGGPAIAKVDEDLFLVGVLSAYVPNRATGEILPGLAVVRSVESFHADVAAITSFDEAKATETPPSSGDQYVSLRAAVFLRDRIRSKAATLSPEELASTTAKIEPELYEDLFDWVLSGSITALESSRQSLRRKDEAGRRKVSFATRIPFRILTELGGGPPAGRTGLPRTDAQILDDVVASLYSEWLAEVKAGRTLG